MQYSLRSIALACLCFPEGWLIILLRCWLCERYLFAWSQQCCSQNTEDFEFARNSVHSFSCCHTIFFPLYMWQCKWWGGMRIKREREREWDVFSMCLTAGFALLHCWRCDTTRLSSFDNFAIANKGCGSAVRTLAMCSKFVSPRQVSAVEWCCWCDRIDQFIANGCTVAVTLFVGSSQCSDVPIPLTLNTWGSTLSALLTAPSDRELWYWRVSVFCSILLSVMRWRQLFLWWFFHVFYCYHCTLNVIGVTSQSRWQWQ